MNRQRADGRQWPRPAWVAAGVVLALGAAAGGWVVADRIAARPPAALPPAHKVFVSGPARLRVSTQWSRAPKAPAVPGLADAPAYAPYAGLSTTVSVALVPPDSATLVPAALVAQAQGGLPKAQSARVVGLPARAFRGVKTGDAVRDVYAIPTTRGVLTVVCSARTGAPEAPAWCLEGLDQITVEGARPIEISPGTAYRMRAPQTLKTLNAARVSQRVALRRSKGPVGQKRAARTLWKAYGAAAAELAPLAAEGDPSAQVVASLRDTARAYRALSVAANRRSKRGWKRARSGVAAAEKALSASVAAA